MGAPGRGREGAACSSRAWRPCAPGGPAARLGGRASCPGRVSAAPGAHRAWTHGRRPGVAWGGGCSTDPASARGTAAGRERRGTSDAPLPGPPPPAAACECRCSPRAPPACRPTRRCLQVHRGALEEEAERCAPLPPPREVLGVPAAAGHCAAHAPQPPRQGPPHGLQGQAGLRCLSRARAPRRPQEARVQGGCLQGGGKSDSRCQGGCRRAAHCRVSGTQGHASIASVQRCGRHGCMPGAAGQRG